MPYTLLQIAGLTHRHTDSHTLVIVYPVRTWLVYICGACINDSVSFQRRYVPCFTVTVLTDIVLRARYYRNLIIIALLLFSCNISHNMTVMHGWHQCAMSPL